MSEEEKLSEYSEEISPPLETYTDSTIEPGLIEDEEARKQKRRRRILIGVFAIALPILLVISAGIFIVLAIIGAFESCAVQCCTSCGESCSDSCSSSCSDSCSSSCSSSIKISIQETIESQINNLKWLFYTIFKL
ncbi:MAG: hypothetical protein KAS22_09085 [Candidatus Heimdallarchaeota archaeon]|nr:hypothetical protein [Candidatus Heimdallarchaeota archaeon]